MAITNASRLADFGSGIGTAGAVLEVDNANKRIGLGTTNPNTTVQVGAVGASGTSLFVHGDSRILGVLTATSFSGTVQASDVSGTVSAATTAAVPGISTQGHTVLGTINAAGIATFAGNVSVGGTLTYDDVTNIDSVGIVTAGKGFRATTGGIIVTAGVGTFKGDVELHGNQGVTSVTFDSSANSLIFKDSSYAKFGTGGDLEIYHDGSNSHISDQGSGVVYLRTNNLQVNNAANNEAMIHATENGLVDLYYDNGRRLITTPTGVEAVGIVSCSVGSDLNGYKVEEGKYDTDALNGEFDFELENGHIQTHTGSTAGTYFPDFRVSSSASLTSVMDVGDVISCTLIVAASNTAHYCTTGIKIDNSTSNLTIEWIGSAAPTAGKGAGYDIYAFTIQKTAATPAYLIIVNATDAG
jgi:hypothetical protein